MQIKFYQLTFACIVSLFLPSSLVIAQTSNNALFSSRLQSAIQDSDEDEFAVYLLLSDQVEVEKLDQSFYETNASLQKRTVTLIHQLKEKANRTQPELVEFIQTSNGLASGSLRTFWITNALAFRANRTLLQRLTQRSDIAFIDIDAPLVLEAYENDLLPAPPPAPGVAESGLITVRANKLWEMGYTGYGRLAMSSDTGIDPAHPAIVHNWRGNFSNPALGWFDTNNSNNSTPSNCGDHGVHTLGTMVGIDRATEDTIGVAFNAQWIGSNTLCGNGTSDNIAVFQWAIDPDNNPNTIEDMPDVINNSWYDPGVNGECSGPYIAILNALEAVGIAVVFSAGNDGPDASTITSPKNINTNLVNTFTVAAVNGNSNSNLVADFSSRGPSNCGGTESLLIKPEVSAPGQGVRSCELDGSYGNKSGTSMAAPHVAGVILLIKEAFPELTGFEIKTAIYNSCRDLGDPGEDNTYGMGMIDALGAFNYLIDLGHTPVDPLVANDAMMIDIEAETRNCDSYLSFDIVFENAGQNVLNSLQVNYQLVDYVGTALVSETINWTGDLATGMRTSIPVVLTDAPEGTLDIRVQVSQPNDQPDGRDYVNEFSRTVMVSGESPISFEYVNGVLPCQSSLGLIQANVPNPSEVRWYFSPSSNAVLSTGPFFQVPANPSLTFYVEATVNTAVGENTLETNSAVFTNMNVGNEGLIFDAHTDLTIKSLKVFSEDNALRLISVRSEAGNQIDQFISNNIVPGENVLDVNFEVPAGDNYQLIITSGKSLGQQTTASYPYQIANIMTIKRSTDFANPTDNYLYFYDIVVEHEHVCGRVPVNLDYQATDIVPQAKFVPSSNPVNLNAGGAVTFDNTSVNGATYYWDFGDGTTSTELSPTHTYSEVGTYEVSLTTVNEEGCGDIEFKNITVEEGVLGIEVDSDILQVAIMPNPTYGVGHLYIQSRNFKNVQVSIIDLHGKIIERNSLSFNYQLTVPLNMIDFPAGVYYVHCLFENQSIIKKIVKL